MLPLLIDEEPPYRDTLTVKPTGLLKATGMGVTKGFVNLAGAASLALEGYVNLVGDEYGKQDLRKWYEEVIKPAKKYWTPEPGSTSTAGSILHGIAGLAAPLSTGPAAPYVLVGEQTINTGYELYEQGVDPITAGILGITAGALSAAQVKLPAAGKTLGQTLGLIALNPALGAVQAQSTKHLLEQEGYDEQAKAYDPFDPVGRSIDTVLGIFFGGMAHYSRVRPKLPTAVEDAIDTAASHQKALKDSPFEQSHGAVNAHLQAREKALSDLSEGKPVDVAAPVRDIMREMTPTPTLDAFIDATKRLFPKIPDEHLLGIRAAIEARARRKGIDPDEYIGSAVAGVVEGQAAEGLLYQRGKTVDSSGDGGVEYTHEGQEVSQVSATQRAFDFGEDGPDKADQEGQLSEIKRTHDQQLADREQYPLVVSKKVDDFITSRLVVSDSDDAAHVASVIAENAQENLLSIITDKDGKILSIYRHSLGTAQSTPVDLKTLVGQALNTEGAAHVYLAHNHPSDTASLSRDDIAISHGVKNLFDGTRVTLKDMLAVTPRRYAGLHKKGELFPEAREQKVPLVERKFERHLSDEFFITSHEKAIEYAERYIPEGGIIFTDSNGRPVGILSSIEDYSRLRGEAQEAMLSEAERRNARSIILYEPKRTLSNAELLNVGKFSSASQIGVLDIIDSRGSLRTMGLDEAVSTGGIDFYQRHGDIDKAAVQFLEDGRAVIHAFKGGDVTSVLHELAHIWRRELEGDALALVEEWAGVKGGKWETAHEEAFAKGFERYWAEGKGPTPELEGLFKQLKQWILDIYRRLVTDDVWRSTLTPEVRKVFDNFFVETELPLRKADLPETAEARGVADTELRALEEETARETAAAEPIPEERTETVDWGAGPTVTQSRRGRIMEEKARERQASAPSERVSALDYAFSEEPRTAELTPERLSFIRDRLATAEGPQSLKDAETGLVVGRTGSGYPEWFQNKGYTQKEVLGIIDKAIKGGELTERQRGIIEDLVLSSEREFRKAQPILNEPVERMVETMIAERGDLPYFEGYDQAGKAVFGSSREVLDRAKADYHRVKDLEETYMRIAQCIRGGG